MSDRTLQVFSGSALLGSDLDFRPADIIVDKGQIIAIEETTRAPDLWICPALFNAHTHLGDTVAMDCAGNGDLVSLVTPPDGLKHRILAETEPAGLMRGMQESIRFMVKRGTAGCADFREGGAPGVIALKEAALDLPFRCIILGRDGGETTANGLGVSSVRDVTDLERMVRDIRQAGGLLAFHAGEMDSLDVDTAISYDPDFIIHATHATEPQLKECADKDIPVVVCPRSNWVLSVTGSNTHPPIRRMLELGCRVWAGTDNVMFVQPDLLSEMAFISTVYHVDPEKIIQMAVEGSELWGEPSYIKKGARANFFVLDPRASNISFSKKPVAGIVNRAFSTDIGKNVFNL
jgi:cytosine/adenosine deaminase-related metal-dependent hydrolase